MISRASLEQARRLVGETIAQTVLDSGNPPKEFVQTFPNRELPTWEEMVEEQISENTASSCTTSRNFQPAQRNTQSR